MAENSKREQILVALKSHLESMSSINAVWRRRPELSEMEQIPATLLPMIAITAGLPKPRQKNSGRGPGANNGDVFLSDLKVDVICYALGVTEPDTVISRLADDVWASLFAMGTLGKRIVELSVEPEVSVGVYDPYIVFKMVATLTYAHTTGGI